MRRHTAWATVYYAAFVIRWTALVATGIVGASPRFDPKFIRLLGAFVVWMQQSTWWLVPVLLAISIAASATCSCVGSPWVWKTIQKLIDELQKVAFSPKDGDPGHFHRVTLFRHTWRWFVWPWRERKNRPGGKLRSPWSGWLVPVARSWHTMHRSNAVFLAPDDADNSEGFAGQVWARNEVIHLDQLPNLAEDASEEKIEEYAIKTWVTVEWVKKRLAEGKPCPRAFCGCPIEVDGRLWGVLVLDSRGENGVKFKASWWTYRLVSLFVAELLKQKG